MDALRRKWDRASRTYDRMVAADERRFAPDKEALFAAMRGRCLMVAAGTGLDFAHFPSGLEVVSIDISRGMLSRACGPAARYRGRLALVQADARRLPFRDDAFDSVVSVCSFCSIPDPVRGLRELHRVLRHGGRILLFEHVRSRIPGIGLMQDLITPLTRRFGPDMNRDTVSNVTRAGFRILREKNVYLDIVKAVEGASD